MMRLSFTLAVLLSASLVAPAKTSLVHTFKKVRLTDQFWAEGADFGDFNRDGHMDIAYGPFWYAGPDFKVRHEYRPATASFKRKLPDGTEKTIPGYEGALGVHNAYSDDFLTFVYDFNGDGWPDILVVGFPGADTTWYENPGEKGGLWAKHKAFSPTDDESPGFTDLTGDNKPELVCIANGSFGYAEPDWSNPTRLWTFHPVTPRDNRFQRFTHGLGVGDVNGDGRMDILEAHGWWEQPASLSGDPVWRFHPFVFSQKGGAQMFAYDVNGDGLNDVITSVFAHGYGLVWWEQVRDNGEIRFKQHVILEPKKEPDRYGVTFSQLHALALADMNGDGLKDIVTGKRFWAHGPEGDVDPNDPAVLYWFELVRHPDHTADFVPHLVDTDSGVGTQVVVGHVQKGKYPDIVVGNKKGAFVFVHQTRRSRQVGFEAGPAKRVAAH
jgi:FG-GAP-like repeat